MLSDSIDGEFWAKSGSGTNVFTYDLFSFKKIDESSLKRIENLCSKGFVSVSAFRGVNTKKENLQCHAEMLSDIRSKGLGYITLLGCYTESSTTGGKLEFYEELSVFVPYIESVMSRDVFAAFGEFIARKYNHDGYIVGDGEVAVCLERTSAGGAYSKRTTCGKFKIDNMAEMYSKLKKGNERDRMFEYARHAVRDCYACKTGATIKRTIPYARHAVADCYACKAGAIIKYPFPYTRHAVRNCYACKSGATTKRTFPYARHVVRD